jgi:hypothetical protein
MNLKHESQIARAEPTGLPCGGWYAATHDEIVRNRDGCGRIFPTPQAAINAAWKTVYASAKSAA